MGRFRKRAAMTLAVIGGVALLAGCGGSSGGSGGLRVLAAASLTDVFPTLATAFAQANGGVKVSFEFAGSDALATQIEEGAQADVYAAASAKFPTKLAGEGRIGKPMPFATNTLVLAVPSGSSKVADLKSVSTPGVKLLVGAVGVPVGDYTRTVLTALDRTEGTGWSAAVLKNVVSQEQSVKSIVAKLQTGDADAGFVYTTDIKAAAGKLTPIAIPQSAKPSATYPIAVVTSSKAKGLAQKWVGFVVSTEGQKILTDAGFGPAPAK